MDPGILSSVGGKVALSLATQITKAAATKLSEFALGSAEKETLDLCIAEALAATMLRREVFKATIEDSQRVQVIEILGRFLCLEEVAIPLVEVAVTGKGNPHTLIHLLESVGLDAKLIGRNS
jgi:hypothetical protein